MHIIRQSLHIILDAFYRFDRDDGWAIASHIALSILMSVFPFLIVVTAIAAFIGSVELADEVARLLIATWPQEVAGPLAIEIHQVLTTSHGGLVTISAIFAVYFSSSGIESLRIGLNRAYELRERRSFWVLRLELIGFVLLSAIALLVVAFLVVLGSFFSRPPPFMCRRSRRSNRITISRVSASAVSCSRSRCSSNTCGCRPDGADLPQCGQASWQRWCCG